MDRGATRRGPPGSINAESCWPLGEAGRFVQAGTDFFGSGRGARFWTCGSRRASRSDSGVGNCYVSFVNACCMRKAAGCSTTSPPTGRQGYSGRPDRDVLCENALGLVRWFHSKRHWLRGWRLPPHDGLRAVRRPPARLPHGARHLAGQLVLPQRRRYGYRRFELNDGPPTGHPIVASLRRLMTTAVIPAFSSPI